MIAMQAAFVAFMFAIGACVGSLINVLVYRLPLGMSVVTPPSRCPACGTRLTWRENIPIFGWLFLRGRCRFCKSAISPEYPLVELFTACLFAGFFVLWYTIPANTFALDINWGSISPEWARNDYFEQWPRQTWPMFTVLIVLLGALTAMTIVDAKTFTIPLELPWFATAVALLFHVGYAMYCTWSGHTFTITAPGCRWSLPLPGWSRLGTTSGPATWWLGASICATAGLIISCILLKLGVLPRSFADYEAWERQAQDEAKARAAAAASPAVAVGEAAESAQAAPTPIESLNEAATPLPTTPHGDHSGVRRSIAAFGMGALLLVALTVAGNFLAPSFGAPRWVGLLAGGLLLPLVCALAMRIMERAAAKPAPQPDELPPHMWIQYPYARREMFKEILFLAPAIILAFVGGWVFQQWLASNPKPPPLWIMVLGGVLQGYLIAGAIVWAVRILGSIGFGKEAMGLGDVHLLAAVGACLGWIDAALAFPLAAVVGLYWVIVSMIRTGGAPRAMPFGPYLAGATVLVLLFKPLIEKGMTWLMAIPPNMPAFNLP